MAGRSRWLVGSSSTRQFTPCAAKRASTARVRSPGESVRARAQHVVGAEAELGEQRAGLGRRAARWRRGRRRAATGRRRTPARAWSISPTTTPGPIHRSPATSGRRRAARGAAWSCPSRWGRRWRPARPTRSRGRPGRGGTRRARTTAPCEPHHHVAAPRRAAPPGTGAPSPPTASRPRRGARAPSRWCAPSPPASPTR